MRSGEYQSNRLKSIVSPGRVICILVVHTSPHSLCKIGRVYVSFRYLFFGQNNCRLRELPKYLFTHERAKMADFDEGLGYRTPDFCCCKSQSETETVNVLRLRCWLFCVAKKNGKKRKTEASHSIWEALLNAHWAGGQCPVSAFYCDFFRNVLGLCVSLSNSLHLFSCKTGATSPSKLFLFNDSF